MFETINTVAFIDDDEALRDANVQTLELAGFAVAPFASARQALDALGEDFAGVVVSDIRMPEMDGRQLFRRLKAVDPDLPVILITGHGDIADAVEAMHEGAYDFVPKPYSADRLVGSVRRALEKRRLVLDNRRLQRAAEGSPQTGPLLGATPAMERLRATIAQLAEADVDVLIEGETGAGKALAATLLHRLSRRRSQPFVTIDCAALPAASLETELFGHEAGAFNGAIRRRVGRIESASRGSLFLDDIATLPLSAQGNFLRIIEEREITPVGANEPRALDLRIFAAATGDLADLVHRGEFRRDLFYRLNVVSIRIPPLRERRDDVPLLFGHFLGEAAARLRRDPPRLTEAVRRHLLEHEWPGNVRELRNFAERVALGLPESGAITVDRGSLPERMERYERELIRETLAAVRGDVRSALKTLGLPRKTFYDKLQKHRIDINRFRRG